MILMHVYDKDKEKMITKIAGEMRQEIKRIDMGQLDCTLNGLCTGKDAKRPVKIPPLYYMPELLVFSGLSETELDAFLEKYKTTGLQPIALKAITTMYNYNWTVMELIEELQKERRNIR